MKKIISVTLTLLLLISMAPMSLASNMGASDLEKQVYHTHGYGGIGLPHHAREVLGTAAGTAFTASKASSAQGGAAISAAFAGILPPLLCVHNVPLGLCPQCNLGPTCPHNVPVGLLCLQCNPIPRCPHGVIMGIGCTECNSSPTCEHNVPASTCPICNMPTMCEHNVPASICLQCNMPTMCAHNFPASTCPICNMPAMCEHNFPEAICPMCNPPVPPPI